MFAPFKIRVGARAVALAVALAGSNFSAQAALERVGPVSNAPTVGGFPAWYQDTTGIALDFCAPTTDAELNGGWCLALPGDIVMPEVFPTNFGGEHFYYAATAEATASLADPARGRAFIVMAQEAAFATDKAVPGDQIVFSRIRVWLSPVPVTGKYRFIHPYGEELLDGIAGERIFFTDDVGIACNGSFDCATKSRLGPFLLPSTTPGGAEMPPLTAANPTPDIDPANFEGLFAPTPYPGTGRAYIADPNRSGPVTGSSLPNFIDSNGVSRNHNMFRIEGPVGSALGIDPATGAPVDWVETTHFSLVGRLYDGAMPGQAKVNRASYTRDANGQKVDVFVSGAAATAARFPAQPAPPKVAPTLTFFDAPCAGTEDAAGAIRPPYSAPEGATETQMLATGTSYWGQIRPAVLPSAVCVKNGNARDAAGNLIPVYAPQIVTDEVTVTQALYDTDAGTLTVAASSSDALVPPQLQLSYKGFIAPLAGGQIVVPNVVAGPASVVVQSSARGVTQYAVNTAYPSGVVLPGTPVATPDSYAFAEDSGAQVLAILANDLDASGGTVTLTSVPTLGTAVVNLDGTVTYTPRANFNGADSFTYTVAVGAQVSSTATVSINLTPVNDAPVALNDSVAVPVNTALQINVLANDTDADGKADLANAVIVTQPAAAATVSGGAGGIVNFIATLQGSYSFTYQAQDAAGALSATTGRVTVSVTAPESVSINRNSYVTSKLELLVEGTTNSPGTPTVTVEFLNSAGTVLGLAGTVVASDGGWKLNTSVALPVGATRIRATTPAGAVSTSQAITFK